MTQQHSYSDDFIRSYSFAIFTYLTENHLLTKEIEENALEFIQNTADEIIPIIKRKASSFSKNNEKDDEPKTNNHKSTTKEDKVKILENSKQLYNVTKKHFGSEYAAKQVIIYIAEQYGIVDWHDIEGNSSDREEIVSKVVNHFENMGE